MSESQFRQNAPSPDPSEDTSEAWFEKLHADALRREKFIRAARTASMVFPVVLWAAFVGCVAAYESAQDAACKAAHGVYVRGTCIAAKEIRP